MVGENWAGGAVEVLAEPIPDGRAWDAGNEDDVTGDEPSCPCGDCSTSRTFAEPYDMAYGLWKDSY